MAAFTTEKQALHDIIARCLVVNGRGQSSSTPWKLLIGLAVAAILSRGVIAQFPPHNFIDEHEEHSEIIEEELNEIPMSGRFTICGFEEQLIKPGNNNIDGDWKLEFSAGGVTHIARLQMEGASGAMRVIFPNGSVDQTMQLYNSSKGIVLLGFYPVDPNTGESVPSYKADNFLIRQEIDSSWTIVNCDDGGNTSPLLQLSLLGMRSLKTNSVAATKSSQQAIVLGIT